MKSRPHLLVGIALEEHDADTLAYAAWLARTVEAKRVTFLHVIRPPDLDHAVYRVFPELRRDIFEAGRTQAKETVDRHGPLPPTIESDFRVVEGSPLVELVRAARGADVDLVVVGRRAQRHWADHLPMRIVRKAPCSVLVVPEGSRPKAERILVPIDFSERSRAALEVALDLAQQAGSATVRPMHAWSPMPTAYFVHDVPTRLAEEVKKAAEEEWETFRGPIETGGRALDLLLLEEPRPSGGVRVAVEREKHDLVILGSRGRTSAAALLLGSVAERVVADATTPVWIVREKGDNETFLRSFLAD